MVIVYTDIYLKKLWTVYEVACFVSLHPSRDLAVVSPAISLFAFGILAVEYFARIFASLAIAWFRTAYGGWADQACRFAPGLLTSALIVFVLRFLAHTREDIRQQLTDFKVEECICAVEADRPVVYSNIVLLMRAKGEVGSDATDEMTRKPFNKLVRKKLRSPLVANVQLDYQLDVGISLCAHLPFVVDFVFGIHPWASTREQFCSMAKWSTFTVGLAPLSWLLLSRWCGLCLRLSRRSEHIFLMCGSLILFLSLYSSSLILDQIWYVCVARDIAGLATLLVLPISALLAATLWGRERRPLKVNDNEDDEAVVPEQSASED